MEDVLDLRDILGSAPASSIVRLGTPTSFIVRLPIGSSSGLALSQELWWDHPTRTSIHTLTVTRTRTRTHIGIPIIRKGACCAAAGANRHETTRQNGRDPCRGRQGDCVMPKSQVTRRAALRLGAAAAALPLVHVRTAGAAGKLSVGFWDHWVPGVNDVTRRQAAEWADKNKVELMADFITSTGNKLLITGAAEAQARVGHDVLRMSNWEIHSNAAVLEPVDDVINELVKKNGPFFDRCAYFAKASGHWRAVPSTTANLTMCGRTSLLKKFGGIDVQAMYPAMPSDKPIGQEWTYDAFLKVAEGIHKGGFPFGQGIGSTNDSINNIGCMFSAFGADLMDAKGDVTVNSDTVRQFLEYAQKLVKFLPPDTVSYDDASNNRALISGKSALIMNPPSAWAVAKRDAPAIAADCWTFPMPAGPKGRFLPFAFNYFGIWEFGTRKSAAKEFVAFMQERKQVEESCTASEGFDIPPSISMSDFKVWEDVEPPRGTVYNYPIRPWHDSVPSSAAYPAPPEFAVQIYQRAIHPGMLAKLHSGQSIGQTIKWAEHEIEGFIR